MKTKNWISSILAAALLAEAGCGQSEEGPRPTIIHGVKVDLAKFQQAFNAAPPELQKSVFKVTMSIRYGQYAEAAAAVEKVANGAGLTDLQKQVAADVLQQLKQVVSRAPAKHTG
ncbi:MAG TPA: hypothetical protein P5205_06260 [Candidatus Paceibacterota bacterium]|nr:hypothetical protein [Verrucomicrobiota bacterium]HSA09958.1 hypothetical protein [Candidatus Paceibacterota bacterium]